MSNELKACPFCGGEAERFTLNDEANFGGDVIACKKCGACSRVIFGEKEGLVESWNTRTQAQPADAYRMARALSDRYADQCGVDKDDNWKLYGQDCIDDVRAMLEGAKHE